jgi:antitoxin CptB
MSETLTAAGELNRLRWRCSHRALREMDIVLGTFLDERFSGLSAPQAAAFVQLADMEDLELWPLITGKRECADAVQAEVVCMLRDVRVK